MIRAASWPRVEDEEDDNVKEDIDLNWSESPSDMDGFVLAKAYYITNFEYSFLQYEEIMITGR
jgi:hypothetical protein